jgi:beta-phosphoglucomutase-like phosphatase (HAD superfamily)
VFLLAAERIGMPPERCVIFEDVPAGIEAAHRGSMKTVALTTTNPSEQLADADLVVRDLSDIDVSCLTELFAGSPVGRSPAK